MSLDEEDTFRAFLRAVEQVRTLLEKKNSEPVFLGCCVWMAIKRSAFSRRRETRIHCRARVQLLCFIELKVKKVLRRRVRKKREATRHCVRYSSSMRSLSRYGSSGERFDIHVSRSRTMSHYIKLSNNSNAHKAFSECIQHVRTCCLVLY